MSELIFGEKEKLEKIQGITEHVPPPTFAEVVVRTARFDEMNLWYRAVLGVKPFIEQRMKRTTAPAGPDTAGRAQDRSGIAFFDITPDAPTSQIFGLFGFWELKDREADHNGVDHFKFYHQNLGDLLERIEKLLDAGFSPYRSANHGPDSSFYFLDPDSNRVELSCSNFPTLEEKLRFVQSDAFKRNISGIEIDPREYIARFRSGIPQAELVKIPEANS